ncbi:uncharacterized protein LOC125672636 [Ostrea edulis]|uniref:uncharacterized protein LOC125672636 n=1 Tax=Ostrea edulis TaxID=37623 RepID=UPI002094BC99|nr:uncharacterized protein LOC125672636 [Ostrea edulis]
MSVSGSFPKEFYQKFRRESLQEPTEWKDIRKYHLMFGDIRTNTTKKMYILGKGGFVLGVWASYMESFTLAHPKNPGSKTLRYFGHCLARYVPMGTFAGLFFGTTWYAWNSYFDRDNFYGVFFAVNATWATCLGPILKKYRKMYNIVPWAFLLGLLHVSNEKNWSPTSKVKNVKFCNPRHYEKDLFGNEIRPMKNISYEID